MITLTQGNVNVVNSSHLSDITFAGTLNDATINGTFSGATNIDYVIEIDAAGTPDTFKWSDDGGATWEATGIAITGTAQELSTADTDRGLSVTFAATTGHALGDSWKFTAYHTKTLPAKVFKCIADGKLRVFWWDGSKEELSFVVGDEYAVDCENIQVVSGTFNIGLDNVNR